MFLKHKKLAEADLHEPPLTVFRRNAVARIFKPDQLRELLELTELVAGGALTQSLLGGGRAKVEE